MADLELRLAAAEQAQQAAAKNLLRLLGEADAVHRAALALIDSHPAPESFASLVEYRFGEMERNPQNPEHTLGRNAAKAAILRAAGEAVAGMTATRH